MARSSQKNQPSFKKLPRYRFKEGLSPALQIDFKRSPAAVIDCSNLSAEEQIELCRSRIVLLKEKMARRGNIVAFPGVPDMFLEGIAEEEAWIEYLRSPLTAKTLVKEPKSKNKALFPSKKGAQLPEPECEAFSSLELALRLDEDPAVQIRQLAKIRSWQSSHPAQYGKLVELEAIALQCECQLLVFDPLPFIVSVAKGDRLLGQIGIGLLSGKWQIKFDKDYRWQVVSSAEEGFRYLREVSW
jgi:hypothetical protein